MPSYNHAYDDDSRRPISRHDSVTRPRDHTYLTPTDSPSYYPHSRQRSPSSASRSPDMDPSRTYKHTYDYRYSFPPPPGPPPSTLARSTREHRSPHRKRRSWPPAPTVENEATSLAKEAGSTELLKELARNEAPSRGTVDQEPILEEVPEFVNQHERRYVVLSDGEKGSQRSASMPTPPTSEDEKARRGRRRPSKLTTEIESIAPEFQKRTASPYAFTKPTSLKKDTSSSQIFMSPETLTPPAIDSRHRLNTRFASESRSQPSLSSTTGKGRDYFSNAYVPNDSAIDDSGAAPSNSSSAAIRTDRRRLSKSEDVPTRSSHTSVVDFAAPDTHTSSIRRSRLDSRRQTESASTMPKPRLDKSYRPSPLMASSALSELGHVNVDPLAMPRRSNLTPPDRREGSYSFRNVSPTSTSARASPSSPQRSPKLNTGGFPEPPPASERSSKNSSTSNSRPGTPPSAPTGAPRLPRSDSDWSNVLADNASRRTKPPSRLHESMRMESNPDVPRSSYPSSSIPRHGDSPLYPVGVPSVFMPSERDYQFFPSAPVTPLGPPIQEPNPPVRSETPGPSASSHFGLRPSVLARHSYANDASPIVPPTHTQLHRSQTSRAVPPTKQEAEALLKRGLPGCPRTEPVAGYDDWYTLVGAPYLDFCPDCIDSVFERTIYRNFFRRSLPRRLDTKIQCAFGTPWIRLAWLLTLQNRRADLTLMKDLADIDSSSEPCPGLHEAVRSWYGLRDPDGLFVRDFQVCYTDVRKLECLLPTLNGLFVRLPHRVSYDKRKCALRAESSNRFSVYLDAIIDMHDKAKASHKLPNPMPFIELVERKLRIRECERDNMLSGALWHYPASIPAFTVCEDCFEEVVEPEIGKNSDVAMRFNRTVQPAYGEGLGTSCQLYSPRMRRVFKAAVRDNDVRYLARKAKERREAELRLQDKYKDVVRRAQGLKTRGNAGEEDERRLEKELDVIAKEWKDTWE